MRPVGGWISDKVGGSIVTQAISAVMVLASVAVGLVMQQAWQSATPETWFPLFLGFFLALVTGWLGGELVDRLGVGVDEGAHVNAPSSLTHRRAIRG